MKRRHLVNWSVVGLVGLIVSGWLFLNSEFVAIDTCLDSGGRWNKAGFCAGAGPGE